MERDIVSMQDETDGALYVEEVELLKKDWGILVALDNTFPGNVAMFNLDGGILPAGNFSQWVQGTVTPLAYVIPVEYSRLVDIVGEGGPGRPFQKTL